MTLDMIRQRLQNQLLTQTKCSQPNEVVEWFGAIQAQDYAGAKWALGQRLEGVTDAAIEKAFSEGTLLRTHVMRPTWHFVTPTDIRWMLRLTAPRVLTAIAFMDRQLGLDQADLKRSNTILVKALQGGKQLMRTELGSILQRSGFQTNENRLGHLLMHAELAGIICSGGRQGKQFTYALLEERAPQSKTMEREEALAELTKRYFQSHGPATLRDFVWWSGLTTTDARQGIELIKSQIESEVLGNQTYWFNTSTPVRKSSPTAYLLPNYDEYTVGYTDRSAIFDEVHTDKLDSRESILAQMILIEGHIAGTWKRTVKKDEVIIQLAPFIPLKKAQEQAVRGAIQNYSRFLGMPVTVA